MQVLKDTIITFFKDTLEVQDVGDKVLSTFSVDCAVGVGFQFERGVVISVNADGTYNGEEVKERRSMDMTYFHISCA